MTELRFEYDGNPDAKREYDLSRAASVLVGICKDVATGGWEEGHRNDMAVDASCAAWMLGIDAEEVLAQLMNELQQHNKVSAADIADMKRRLLKVEPYLPSWDQRGGIDLFWLCPQRWVDSAEWNVPGLDITIERSNA